MPQDYSVFIADLEIQRTELQRQLSAVDAAIEGARVLNTMYTGAYVGVRPLAQAASTQRNTSAGKYDNMSIPLAAETCIRQAARALSTRELTDSLIAGGFKTTAKSFSTTLGSVLNRHWKDVGRVIRVNNAWSLAEWQKEKPNETVAA